MKKKSVLITGLLILIVLSTYLVMAAGDVPAAPKGVVREGSTRFDPTNYADQTQDIVAGNITQLTIDAISQTRAWAGFYGNISGTITLDDASNYTFYNWTSAEPQGQVYATLTNTVDWNNLNCMDFTDVTGNVNETIFENHYGIETDDVDGVEETFNWTNHPAFTVGYRSFTGCPTTYVYQNDAAQSTNFVNVLLADDNNDADGWVFTTLIENKDANQTGTDKACYNGEDCDFQILVADDGHDTNVAVTTYYIWVELI